MLKRWARIVLIILIIMGIFGDFLIFLLGNPLGLIRMIFWSIMGYYLLFNDDVIEAFRKDVSEQLPVEYDENPMERYSDYRFFKGK